MMSFDIRAVVKDMGAAMKETLEEDLGELEDFGKEILENEKESLEAIGKERVAGRWSKEKFDKELEREKKVIEVGLLTIQIMTKAAAQRAVNAAIEVFVKAVKAALPI
jgi:tRNA A-37 threonylcarbamoyl transferase component Bud32